MDWSGLGLNLATEAIGILFTLIVVNRLLKLRDQRAWKNVRETFLAQAELICDDTWAAFEAWFESLAHVQQPARGWEHVETEVEWRANATEVLKLFESLYGLASQKAEARIDDRLVRDVSHLQSRITKGFLPAPLRAHASWNEFHDRAYPLLDRFDGFVARHSSLLDSEFALIVIRLRRDLDLLDVVEGRREGPGTEQPDIYDRVAGLVASQLLQIALLNQYVRRYRTSKASPWLPSIGLSKG